MVLSGYKWNFSLKVEVKMEISNNDKKNIENKDNLLTPKVSLDFIRTIINEDLKNNKNDSKVITRFPPEPNGYLHIGHAKSICLNFGIAAQYNGVCHLRFDDTNPVKEDVEYTESIKRDVKWLGFDWGNRLHHASDYFDQLYDYAIQLIKLGKAYVCDLTAEQVKETRGTLTEPGKESPYRNRSVEENLELFDGMRAGKYEDGSKTLRAKIDMASGNINMRDPAIYRIRREHHQMTGDKWCIYPMYDFTHCLSDSIEGITHSICTLEFEDHRPLYDWFLDELKVKCHPQQIEFARLNLNYTVMSKRKLLLLVKEGHVSGWDDPRMPTIVGLRRRGFTPEAIRNFCDRIGVAKRESVVDYALLEHCLREGLNKQSVRIMAVLNPLKVVIENYPDDKVEMIEAVNNPEDPSMGTREVPFTKVIYIEKDDFREDPPKKFFRLALGAEVRLKHAYFIKCTEVIKNNNGETVELRCTYDPKSKGGESPDGRKVKGTLQWVSEAHAVEAEVRLYDHLFNNENPEDGGDFLKNLNMESLKVLKNCKIEPWVMTKESKGIPVQFIRLGYFCFDSRDSKPEYPVFNRTVSLKDSWSKIEKSDKM